MHSIIIRIPFDAAHRLLGHTGKCRFIHGHSYGATVTVESPNLTILGMVADFGDVKGIIKEWIDSQWDHNVLTHINDPLTDYFNRDPSLFNGRKPYVMRCNPTAENMAKELFNAITGSPKFMMTGARCVSVKIQETENCSASYTPNKD